MTPLFIIRLQTPLYFRGGERDQRCTSLRFKLRATKDLPHLAVRVRRGRAWRFLQMQEVGLGPLKPRSRPP